MANMFFAGIPLEGSGGRPLEADLYGAEQQATDAENISATGNLNIGNVIDYEQHIQRYLSGGIQTHPEENAPAATNNTRLPAEFDTAPNTNSVRGNDSNEVSNTAAPAAEQAPAPSPVAPAPAPQPTASTLPANNAQSSASRTSPPGV